MMTTIAKTLLFIDVYANRRAYVDSMTACGFVGAHDMSRRQLYTFFKGMINGE